MMKNSNKKSGSSAGFYEDKRVKKVMSNPSRRASIAAKGHYLEFLEDIEKLRKEKGISQDRLAGMTKIGQEELSRIERGKRNITFETYFRILESLGYEPVVKYRKIQQHQA